MALGSDAGGQYCMHLCPAFRGPFVGQQEELLEDSRTHLLVPMHALGLRGLLVTWNWLTSGSEWARLCFKVALLGMPLT